METPGGYEVPLDEGGTLLLRTWNTPPAREGAQPDTTFTLLSFSGFLSLLVGETVSRVRVVGTVVM